MVSIRILLSPYSTASETSSVRYIQGADGNYLTTVDYDTQIVFAGTTEDGPMVAGLARSQEDGRPFATVLRAVDYDVRNSDRPFLPSESLIDPPGRNPLLLKTFDLGYTNWRNSDLMDSNTGRGIVAEAYFHGQSAIGEGIGLFYDPAWARFGASFSPSSIDFFHRWAASQYASSLVQDLRLDLPQLVQDAFDATTQEARSLLSGIRRPQLTEVMSVQHISFPDDNAAYDCLEYSPQQVVDERGPSTPSLRREPTLDLSDQDDVFVSCPNSPVRRSDISLSLQERSTLLRRGCQSAKDEYGKLKTVATSDLAFSRYKGAISIVKSLTLDAVRAVGIAGIVAAAAFIILDFVDGDWQAATWGTAGLALGLAAFEIVGGPIGVLIGTLVTAFFVVLPTLFGLLKAQPPSNNITKVLQASFFGDMDHTGNEGCNDQRKKAGLEQNCTALYGPRTLAKVFKWEEFDAVVFQIVFNQGFPMSIPDIVNAFNVTDYTINNGQGGGPAQIDCGKSYQQLVYGGRYPSQHDGPLLSPGAGYDCGSPKYSIDKTRITIPIINQTAASVYERIIPAPGGDCKIVAQAPSGINLPLYNVTITGLPAALACNVTTEFGLTIDVSNNTNGTSWSRNGTTTYHPQSVLNSSLTQGGLISNYTGTASLSTFFPQNSSGAHLVSPGLASDGSSGIAFQPAPPATPFQYLPLASTVCMSGPQENLCLPNGTYDAPGGAFGFGIGTATSYTIPANSSLNFAYSYLSGPYTPVHVNVTLHNITAPVGSHVTFPNGAKQMGQFGGQLNLAVPVPLPVGVCLFQRASFRGDVACYGPGGGNLSSTVAGVAQSMRVLGQASVWVYARGYNDTGGALVSTDVSDLTTLTYGRNDNFNQKIRALWISPPSKGGG